MKVINGIILMTFVALAAIAQPHQHRGDKEEMKAKNPELHQALQQHFKTNIFPVLTEKKADFDKSLSRKQRKELDKLRQKDKALKGKDKALHEKIKAEHEAGKDREEVREMYGKEMRQQRIEQMKFHDEVMTWIEANEEDVKTAMEDLKPMHEKWQTEKKAIFEANRPDNEEAKKENCEEKPEGEKGKRPHHKHGKKHGKGHGKHGHHKGHHGNHKEMAAVKFVLWDGELPAEMETTTAKTTSDVIEKSLKLSTYPNPANSVTTVKFDLPNDAKLVELVITSKNGQTVKQLSYSNLDAGKQEVEVDISNLQKGEYFYTIIADNLKKTEKLIIR